MRIFCFRRLPLLAAAAASLVLPCRAAETQVVAAVKVERGDLAQDVSFEAELRPFQEVELHAKVTGFLETISVDAGDNVKAGDVIATLDVPELKIEIEHAQATERRGKAEVDRAKAAYEEVHLAYTRIQATDKAQPHLIAAQDLDAASARDRSGLAAIEAAREQANVAEADVRKLQTMLDYSKITAPFTGVITRRNVDPGALIQAGTSTGAMPLVRLSENDKLRAVFPVSTSFVAQIKTGDPVDINVSSMNRVIHGKVARFSRKVETATRTMDVEVDVENPDLSLIPGIYATAVLKADHRKGVLMAPLAAVVREKDGGSLYVITKDKKIEERKAKLGVETPSMIEILGGVAEDEMVMMGNRSMVKPGQVVEPKLIELPPAQTGKPEHTAKAG